MYYLENVSKVLFPVTKTFLTPYCLVSLPPPAPVSNYLTIILIRDPFDAEVPTFSPDFTALGQLADSDQLCVSSPVCQHILN